MAPDGILKPSKEEESIINLGISTIYTVRRKKLGAFIEAKTKRKARTVQENSYNQIKIKKII